MILPAVLPWVMAAFSLSLVLAAWRLFRGPGLPDRILALDTLYINALALLVALGVWEKLHPPDIEELHKYQR